MNSLNLFFFKWERVDVTTREYCFIVSRHNVQFLVADLRPQSSTDGFYCKYVIGKFSAIRSTDINSFLESFSLSRLVDFHQCRADVGLALRANRAGVVLALFKVLYPLRWD